ncbi:MAG: hypothetical protein AAF927_33520 [Bacteroidota bacterium]
MRYLLLFLFFPLFAQAQTPISTFPNDWMGDWYGKMTIYNAKGKAQELNMELHLAPTDSSDRWQWTLVYEVDTVRDERKYELVAKDASIGHYVIDEKNSILLDSYLYSNVLTSRFSVNNSLLIVNYTFHADRIEFQILVGGLDKVITTGEEVEEVESILSYPMSAMQRSTLYRR